jgi:hypothetical protein
VSLPEKVRGRLSDARAARDFVLGGRAVFTLQSRRTGNRFTFSVRRPEDKPQGGLWFVGLLSGPDNTSDFQYVGLVREGTLGQRFEHGRKSRVSPDAPSVVAIDWFLRQLAKNQLPDAVEVWHEGRCCRCARPLTVPSSVASGIGPECAKKAGAL